MANKHTQRNNKQQKKQQNLMAWTFGIIVLACIGLFVYGAVSEDEAGTNNGTGTAATPVDQSVFQYDKQPALGSADAPVQLVEFADFKCPACKAFDETILPQLKKDYIDTGIVQLHFVNYPIIAPNGDSRTAAEAGEAVFAQKPEAFWPFYEAVFKAQKDERTAWATATELTNIAKSANLPLDFDKLKKDIDDKTYAQNVKDDEAIVRELKVNSTPTVFVNGKRLSSDDTFTYSALQREIEAAKADGAK